MKNRFTRTLFGVLPSFFALSVHAEVRIELSAVASSGTPDYSNNYSLTEPFGTSAAQSISFLGSFASASASLSAGTLRAFAHAANDGIGLGTIGQAVLGDNFSFNGGYGQVAYLDYIFEGAIDVEENKVANIPPLTFAGMGIYVANSSRGQSWTYGLALTSTPGGCSALNFANSSLGCFEGTSISGAGSVAIDIQAGDFYILNSLSAVAAAGDTVDFQNTARYYLRLPDGVTIESRTGEFLATATPLTPVPEPSAYAFMLAGLVGAAWISRRARR
jgi:hypothetical protein